MTVLLKIFILELLFVKHVHSLLYKDSRTKSANLVQDFRTKIADPVDSVPGIPWVGML